MKFDLVKKAQSMNIGFMNTIRWVIAWLLLPTYLGCTNNLSLNKDSLVIGGNPIGGNSIESGKLQNGALNPITLTRVIKDTINPTTVLDLLGDGSNAIGTLCTASENNSSTSSSNVCNCTYTYSSMTHPNQKIDTPSIYNETNMIRCSYAGLPSDVTSINVSIHLTNVDLYSNSIDFQMNASGAYADTSDISLFSKIIRFQCRDIVNISYLFDSNMYDPFLSEDFHLTYPLDFYSNNLGATISNYSASTASQSSLAYWECPSILEPGKYLTQSTLDEYNSNFHLNMNIYSKAPLNGDTSIYPPTPGGIDRSTFYLAKNSIGVFTVPVNAYLGPQIISSTDNLPPLGYGASPVSTIAGQETCPDSSVIIPFKFKWAKLWLFRASLAERHFATSSSLATQVGSISCAPGDYMNTQSKQWTPVYAGCELQKAHAGTSKTYSISIDDLATYDLPIADRVMKSGICVRLFDETRSSGNYCGTQGGTLYPGPSCGPTNLWDTTGFPFDLWEIEKPALSSTAQVGCFESPVIDPFKLCSNNTSTPVNPFSSDIISSSVDSQSGNSAVNSRFDFLFVVSPPNITVADMQNSAASSPGLPYHPYRFLTNLDCLSNPENPQAGDCLSTNMINTYGLKLHDVGSLGDPPADDPNRAGVFPVCVLQPSE